MLLRCNAMPYSREKACRIIAGLAAERISSNLELDFDQAHSN